MTYEEKREYVYNFILVGLSLNEALIHAGMSDKEIERTTKDELFQTEIQFRQTEEHIRLRKLYNDTAEIAAKQKLDWKAALSLLETRFPETYKNKNNNNEPQKILIISEDDKKL